MDALPGTVSDVLGLGEGSPPGLLSLVSAVENGLPLSALDRVAGLVAPGDAVFPHRLVPRATLARRRGPGAATPARLSREESARVARVAETWSVAREVWGSDDEARRFLFTPHMLLDGQRPIDVVLANEHGRPAVEGILGRLRYGSAV